MSQRTTRRVTPILTAICLGLTVGNLSLNLACAGKSQDKETPAPAISSFLACRNNTFDTTIPNLTGTSISVANGDTAYLKAAFAGTGATGVITPGNLTVRPGQILPVGPLSASTTYALTVTDSSGRKATASATVNVLSITTSSDSLGKIIAGSTGNTASVPTATGRTFAWSILNGSITGSTTGNQITFSADTDATKSVTLTCVVTDTGSGATTVNKSLQIFTPIAFNSSVYSTKSGVAIPANYTVDSTVTGFSLTNLTASTLVGTRDTSTTKTGSFNLAPTVTTNYRATVTGSTPTYTYQTDFQVVVSPSDPSTISTFTATPNFLTIDAANLQTQSASTASSNLAWTLAGDPPTSLTLDGSNITGTGTTVYPRNRQTFTLKSANDGNPLGDTKSVSVGVRGLDLLAGSMGGTGMRDGAAALASFQRPQNMCVSGNFLFVADTSNHTIRKIDLNTKVVTTIAGVPGVSGTTDVSNGDPLTAKFNSPRGVAVDAQGYIWVADGGNNTLRVISPDNKYVYTVSGWTSTTGGPQQVFVNNDGTTCTAFVATYNGTVLQFNVTGLGSTTTAPAASLAKTFIVNGTGTATASSVGGCALVMVGSTPVIFAPDSVNKTIKACYLDGSSNPQVANVTPTLTTPTWVAPAAVAATISGTTATVYVADKHFVVRYNVDLSPLPAAPPPTPAGTPVVIGTATQGFVDGPGNLATFSGPQGLAISGSTLYVAEGSYQWSSSPNIYSNDIRAIAAAGTATDNTGMTVSTFAGTNRAAVYSNKVPTTGTSTGAAARFKTPGHVAVDANGNSYLVDTGNSRIVMVAPDGTTSNWPADSTTWSTPLAAVPDNSATPTVYVIESGAATLKKFVPGNATPQTIALSAALTGIKQAVYYKTGGSEYLFTVDGTGKTIKRIDLSTGTVAVNAYATAASGYFGVAVDQNGKLYVSEGSQISYFTFDSATSTAPTAIAGNNSATYGTANGFVDSAVGTNAVFYQPGSLAYYYDAAGSQGYLYVVDARNSAIRKIALTGTNGVSTLIGRGNGIAATSSSVPPSPFYTSALLGIMPGLLEPDTTAGTKALAGSITISTLTTQGLAVNPNTGDLVITSCDCLMQLTGPLNK